MAKIPYSEPLWRSPCDFSRTSSTVGPMPAPCRRAPSGASVAWAQARIRAAPAAPDIRPIAEGVARMRTRITELLGIEHPIIQGGMHYVGFAELAAAVSNAGGLGIITGLTQRTPEALAAEIARCREMTDKPFGVNLTFLPTVASPDYPGYVRAIIEGGVPVVETAGRNPEAVLPYLKGAGVKVIHKCTSVRHALKAQSIGCDAVSVDGFECGGHPGEDDVPNMILLPRAADELEIPFVASGGQADGRSLVASLAMGADGINMGTRFIATQEAPVHQRVKDAIVAASELDTRLVMRPLRNTERVMVNAAVEQLLAKEKELGSDLAFEDIIEQVAGVYPRIMIEGDMDAGAWSCGMVAGLIHDIPTCKELIDRIMAEAEEIIRGRLERDAGPGRCCLTGGASRAIQTPGDPVPSSPPAPSSLPRTIARVILGGFLLFAGRRSPDPPARGVPGAGAHVAAPRPGLRRRGLGGRRDRPRARADRPAPVPRPGRLDRRRVLRRDLPGQHLAVRHRDRRLRPGHRPGAAHPAVLPAAPGRLGPVVHGRLGGVARESPPAQILREGSDPSCRRGGSDPKRRVCERLRGLQGVELVLLDRPVEGLEERPAGLDLGVPVGGHVQLLHLLGHRQGCRHQLLGTTTASRNPAFTASCGRTSQR